MEKFITGLVFVLGMVGCGTDYYESKNLVGPQGETGATGATGSTAAPCTVITVSSAGFAPNGGALITCGLSRVLVLNGATGQAGQAGQAGQVGEDGQDGQSSPYMITEIVDPCGDAPGIYDEVLIRIGSMLLASFSDNANGKNTRLSLLVSGNYVTTDGSNCHFSVDNNNNVTY